MFSDKECPLFNKSAEDFDTSTTTSTDPSILIKQMEEEGLALKKNISSEQKQNNIVINMLGKGSWTKGFETEVRFLKKLDAEEQLKILK